MLCEQALHTGTELQQLESDVNCVLSEGRGLIHSSPVGVDTSDIELTVDSLSKQLTDINQRVNTTSSLPVAYQWILTLYLFYLLFTCSQFSVKPIYGTKCLNVLWSFETLMCR